MVTGIVEAAAVAGIASATVNVGRAANGAVKRYKAKKAAKYERARKLRRKEEVIQATGLAGVVGGVILLICLL